MSLACAVLLLALLAPARARASGPAHPTAPAAAPAPKPAVLLLRHLPAGSRVTLDGVPVGNPTGPITVAPGAYVLDIYPPAAPTLETFVDLAPGARRTVTYRAGPPPDPLPRPAPVVGRALVGAGVVAALASATWWLLADDSAGAQVRVEGQAGLDPATRATILGELRAREGLRREVSVATGVTAGLLLVGGAVVWRALDAGATVIPTVAPVPGGAVGGSPFASPDWIRPAPPSAG